MGWPQALGVDFQLVAVVEILVEEIFVGLRGTRNRTQPANTAKGIAYNGVDRDNEDAVAHRFVIMCCDHKVSLWQVSIF
jgi:hypothetical protein